MSLEKDAKLLSDISKLENVNVVIRSKPEAEIAKMRNKNVSSVVYVGSPVSAH